VHRPEDDDSPSGAGPAVQSPGGHGGHGPGGPGGAGDSPAVCGWDDRTLVVQSGAADDDHPLFEQRFSLSEDGQRLIEVVGFKSGRSAGFTLSREWNRVLPDAPVSNAVPTAPPAPAVIRPQ
jgi:hypothetical protein